MNSITGDRIGSIAMPGQTDWEIYRVLNGQAALVISESCPPNMAEATVAIGTKALHYNRLRFMGRGAFNSVYSDRYTPGAYKLSNDPSSVQSMVPNGMGVGSLRVSEALRCGLNTMNTKERTIGGIAVSAMETFAALFPNDLAIRHVVAMQRIDGHHPAPEILSDRLSPSRLHSLLSESVARMGIEPDKASFDIGNPRNFIMTGPDAVTKIDTGMYRYYDSKVTRSILRD